MCAFVCLLVWHAWYDVWNVMWGVGCGCLWGVRMGICEDLHACVHFNTLNGGFILYFSETRTGGNVVTSVAAYSAN